MKKLLIIILLFTGLTGFKQDNNICVTGTVTAKEDGLPIPGVTVKVKGTLIGTNTNSNGQYAISAPANATLEFCFIGYTSQFVPINNRNKINVVLEASSQQLGEVVVTTAYGIKTKSSSLGYATATISNKYLNQSAATNIQTGITGKVSGLNINLANAAPVNIDDESYKSINEHGFNNTADVPLSTFSVDVDGASYSNIRRFINSGQMPPPDAVRIEEMVNYFNYKIDGPVNNDPVAIHTELSSAPWNPAHRLLRIALKAKTIAADKLLASNLVFLLDVSGSMAEENKLPLIKSSMKMLVEQLRPIDKVNIVAYAGQAGLVLGTTKGDKKAVIDSAINMLNAGGSTNGGEGIKLAYKMAIANFVKGGNNRIIMATDGDFNVGPASDEDMETLITKERESNVALSILGVGMGNLKDSKMEILADKGNGNYFYIDNITEARKALVSEFGGTLFTVAKDVKLQVEFNPAKVQAYRLLGYEDRMLNKEDFNNDKKDAGDMGSGHTVTALYEIIPAGVKDDYSQSVDPLKYQKPVNTSAYSGSDEMLTIKFRYKQPDSMTSKLSQDVVKDTPVELDKSSVDFKFVAALAEFGMLLRDSEYKQKATYDQAIGLAREGKGEDHDGYRAEFIKLAESAKLMVKSDLASK